MKMGQVNLQCLRYQSIYRSVSLVKIHKMHGFFFLLSGEFL